MGVWDCYKPLVIYSYHYSYCATAALGIRAPLPKPRVGARSPGAGPGGGAGAEGGAGGGGAGPLEGTRAPVLRRHSINKICPWYLTEPFSSLNPIFFFFFFTFSCLSAALLVALLACPSPSLRCLGAEEGGWKVLPSVGHLGERPGVGAGQRTCPERRLRLSKPSSFGGC